MLMFILLLALAITVLYGLVWLGREYITWSPAALHVEAMSKHVNLPRLQGERLSVWGDRVDAAWNELLAAGDAFLEAAYKEGWMTHESPRVIHWHLPEGHPVAIRYAKAKGLAR